MIFTFWKKYKHRKTIFLWFFHTGPQLLSFDKIRYKIKKKVCNFSFVCFGLMQHFEYLWLLFTIMELISREGLLGFHYDCNGAAISRAYNTLWPEFPDFVHKLWGLILFSKRSISWSYNLCFVSCFFLIFNIFTSQQLTMSEIMLDFLGSSWTPLPTLKLDVIYACSLRRQKCLQRTVA